ncbi:hypothetical protein [Flexivirga oryzae]|uniref:Uncharacterized protein n=1 Tax=Flexivirga oryzae TaxID=1794944 RepID=A0A839N3I5_9MICO|nr:hypothetical protein [Flexivirga oryzae]MBB2890523.1 hypothetical protein [Flexivirga oryzae]
MTSYLAPTHTRAAAPARGARFALPSCPDRECTKRPERVLGEQRLQENTA